MLLRTLSTTASPPAWSRCCCCAALLGAASAAWSQSSPSPTGAVTLPTVRVTAPTDGNDVGYTATRTTTATKTETPLRDVPQAVTVVPRAAIEDQAMDGLGDVV
ncbi:MAG TPA: hypothetical protein VGE10_01300, partial [Zeimonas sp.]